MSRRGSICAARVCIVCVLYVSLSLQVYAMQLNMSYLCEQKGLNLCSTCVYCMCVVRVVVSTSVCHAVELEIFA